MASLRDHRESLGLNALELATRAGCDVSVIVAAELGTCLPLDRGVRCRLARAYELPLSGFLDLALDAAQRWEDAHWSAGPPQNARPGFW